MTDISKADEREAREWLSRMASGESEGLTIGVHSTSNARTILALLDRRMPRPEELDDDDIKAAMARWETTNDGGFTRTVYRALWDRYNPPPAPKKVEMWAIKSARGEPGGVFLQKSDAERCLERASGSRIVRLVEASDDHQ